MVSDRQHVFSGEAEGLRLHQHDAVGDADGTFYGTVAVGDTLTWWHSSDCWVLYRVTGVPRELPGDEHCEFAVESMTGTGGASCAGAGADPLVGDASVTFRWGPPAALIDEAGGVPALPYRERCTMLADADCIREVYLGAPDDYAQVVDIPAEVLLTPDTDGRYVVQRGQQVTVVTAAPLPSGWTRFLARPEPLEFGIPSPTSFEQLIQPIGTTYTFTVTDGAAGAGVITFDLTAARPHPVRPTHTG